MDGVKMYRYMISFTFRRSEQVPEYVEMTAFVDAPTAEDALTLLRVNEPCLELKVFRMVVMTQAQFPYSYSSSVSNFKGHQV